MYNNSVRCKKYSKSEEGAKVPSFFYVHRSVVGSCDYRSRMM
jgi:hypothetical protein